LYERVHWYIVVFDGNKAQYMLMCYVHVGARCHSILRYLFLCVFYILLFLALFLRVYSKICRKLPVYWRSRIILFAVVGPLLVSHSTHKFILLQMFQFRNAGLVKCTFDSDGQHDLIMWTYLNTTALKYEMRCLQNKVFSIFKLQIF
jgi:hypothetical protein